MLEKIPSVGEVWIFSETTQKCTLLFICLSVCQFIYYTFPKCLKTAAAQSVCDAKSVTSSGTTRKSSSNVNGKILLAKSTKQ